MRLENAAGHSLQLGIVGYQFPAGTDDDWDDSWLIIDGHVANAEGAWSFRDASLTTVDVGELAAWLSAIGDGQIPTGSHLVFLEPNLSFERRAQSVLRVFFDLEARPPWVERAAGLRDLFLDFEPTPDELREAAAALRSDLERLPPRGGRADTSRES